ncbi:hypothetical protein [Amycolatopsis pithecellobii]|nr:hypothetical protein [Amycolatopsis pithecellobii]
MEYLTPAIEDRAVEVLTLLADKDFDLIGEISGQPLERLTLTA